MHTLQSTQHSSHLSSLPIKKKARTIIHFLEFTVHKQTPNPSSFDDNNVVDDDDDYNSGGGGDNNNDNDDDEEDDGGNIIYINTYG